MSLLFSVLLNLCLSSFVACLSERRCTNDSLLTRSHCQSCQQTLPWHQLIPIVSYLFAKGHCRYCKAPIPKLLFITECIGLANGIYIGHCFVASSDMLLYSLIANTLLLLSLDDYRSQSIHNIDLWLLAALIGIDVFFSSSFITFHLLGAVIISLPLLLLYFFYPSQLGSGDIYFLAITGFWLGLFYIPYAFAAGIFLSLVYAIYLLKTQKATRHTPIPMIPFLATGVWIIFILLEYL